MRPPHCAAPQLRHKEISANPCEEQYLRKAITMDLISVRMFHGGIPRGVQVSITADVVELTEPLRLLSSYTFNVMRQDG